MGAGLGLALHRAGHPVALLSRGPRRTPSELTLHEPATWPPALAGAGTVLIAAPDDAIAAVASTLSSIDALRPEHVVLHLSGLLDHSVLAPLARSGAALGSLHPLQSIADPATAPALLDGAYAAVEGEPRAVERARALALAVGLRPVAVAAGSKAAYHAAAAIVSNYSVVLADVARRIAERAGIDAELAGEMYLPLLAGTAANLRALGPARALTGAVRRGDAATVRAHLAALDDEERELYIGLARRALRLAVEAGLPAEPAELVERELH